MKKDSSSPDLCIAVDSMPSLQDPGILTHRVPLVVANSETFSPYGRLVTDYEQEDVIIVPWPTSGWRELEDGTGNEGGIAEGQFNFERCGGLMLGRNHAVDGNYITGWFNDPAFAQADDTNVDVSRVLVREANYHGDGGQVFFPEDATPFIALLALPGDDIRPDDFVAFYCDGSFGIQIYPNIWHQPVFPLTKTARFKGKQGRVHACVACDFVAEFNTYLSVPLPTQGPTLFNSDK